MINSPATSPRDTRDTQFATASATCASRQERTCTCVPAKRSEAFLDDHDEVGGFIARCEQPPREWARADPNPPVRAAACRLCFRSRRTHAPRPSLRSRSWCQEHGSRASLVRDVVCLREALEPSPALPCHERRTPWWWPLSPTPPRHGV